MYECVKADFVYLPFLLSTYIFKVGFLELIVLSRVATHLPPSPDTGVTCATMLIFRCQLGNLNSGPHARWQILCPLSHLSSPT